MENINERAAAAAQTRADAPHIIFIWEAQTWKIYKPVLSGAVIF